MGNKAEEGWSSREQLPSPPPPRPRIIISPGTHDWARDPLMATKLAQLPHLRSGELHLLGYATDDSRDAVTLSDQEALILQLANQVHEQQLEKALLESGTI